MNSTSISGNVSQDAEIRYLPNGDAVASFSVADNQGKDKPAIFWRCSLFGKRAESLSQWLVKGQAVTVIGGITENEWTDKEGNKRKSMDVRVNDVALQGGKREDAPRENKAPAPRQQAAPPAQRKQPDFSDMDDDIPFIFNNIGYSTDSVSRQLTRSKHGRNSDDQF